MYLSWRPGWKAALLALTLLVAGLLSFVAAAPPTHAGSLSKIYWTDSTNGTIGRANLDGSGVEELVTGLDSPDGIAVDGAAGKMYWAEIGVAPGKVSRANLDGTNIEALVTTDCCSGGSFIALDVAGGKMYWTSLNEGVVRRANLDGSAAETIVSGENNPLGLAVDSAEGRVYWTFLLGGIKSAGLDGTAILTISSAPEVPIALSLDASAGLLYATGIVIGGPTDPIYSQILSVPVAGGPSQPVRFDAKDGIRDVAYDPASGGVLYWTDVNLGAIRRWDPDGVDQPTDIVTGFGEPNSLALDISDVSNPVGGEALDGGLAQLPADGGKSFLFPVLVTLAGVLASVVVVWRLRPAR